MKSLHKILVISIFLFIGACSGGSPEGMARSALGSATGDNDQGVAAFKYYKQDKSAEIEYHFKQTSDVEIDKQISKAIADAVHDFFTKSNKFNYVTFIIDFPFKDQNGKITWVRGKQISFDKNTVSKINWDDFDKSTLLEFSN